MKMKKGRLPSIKLQILTLRENGIAKMGIENISLILKNNHTLKYLDLAFNNLDDICLEILSESIKANKCLRYLNLLGNEFSDQGVSSLMHAIEFDRTRDQNTTIMILKLGDIN
jgi:Ran GTPase-activating protein (RanGAP) involved in mRNA processing and transport